ncbi:MAG: hypothetical protein LN410_00475 [Candidatus Thermoplasmatota archaeon]|nr:hypothetical protein [Candidatus Thermoplasmatota archaeon]
MVRGNVEERVFALEKDFRRLEGKLERLLVKLDRDHREQQDLSKEMARRKKGEAVLWEALGLGPRAKIGDRGILAEMDDSVLRLEDYLLQLGERVQRILTMLQGHKEFLDKVSQSVIGHGLRERTRLELDIAMNTISILSVAGLRIDPRIPNEMERLRRALAEKDQDLEEIRRRKTELDRRLEGEIKQYDVERLFDPDSEIAGYR